MKPWYVEPLVCEGRTQLPFGNFATYLGANLSVVEAAESLVQISGRVELREFQGTYRLVFLDVDVSSIALVHDETGSHNIPLPNLYVFLTDKKPKSRMVDLEESCKLVKLKLDPSGRGCIGTYQTCDTFQQVIDDLIDPFSIMGLVIAKLPSDPPITSEPVIYATAKMEKPKDEIIRTSQALGIDKAQAMMQEMLRLYSNNPKAEKLNKKEDDDDEDEVENEEYDELAAIEELLADFDYKTNMKPLNQYARQSVKIWKLLGLDASHVNDNDEEEKGEGPLNMTYDQFLSALDTLNVYCLEPRARRLFKAFNRSTKSAEISILDFESALILHDLIPSESRISPFQAFYAFDLQETGAIDVFAFEEAMSTLILQENDEKEKYASYEVIVMTTDKYRSLFTSVSRGSRVIEYKQFRRAFVNTIDLSNEVKRIGITVDRFQYMKDIVTEAYANEEKKYLSYFDDVVDKIEAYKRLQRIKKETVKRQAQEKIQLIKRENIRIESLENAVLRGNRKKQELDMSRRREEAKLIREQADNQELAASAYRTKQTRVDMMNQSLKEKEKIEMESLDKLVLSSKLMTHVPTSLYVGQVAQKRLSVLVDLDLSHNSITEIPSSATQNANGDFLYWLESLRRFDLSYNLLSHIPNEIRYIVNLQILDLSYNQIQDLPDGFGELRLLQQLVLSNNRLTLLPECMSGCVSLVCIKAHSNHISNIHPVVCERLVLLEQIDLSHNKHSMKIGCQGDSSNMHELPESFTQLKKLKCVNLTGNSIMHLPNDIGLLTDLEMLDVTGNKLSTIPMSFASLKYLKILILDDNYLEFLEVATLKELDSILELSANHNRVTNFWKINDADIPTDFHFRFLDFIQSLSLESNKIIKIPPEIGLMRRLMHLNLRNNCIDCIPIEFGGLSSLHHCDLSHNQIQGTIPESLGILINLTFLNLSHNIISCLPGGIRGLHNLQELLLSNNKLTLISRELNVFHSMHRLTLLDLSCNCFTSFPIEILSAPSLVHIHLSSNRIRRLPECINQMQSSVKELFLDHNDLSCLPPQFARVLHLVPLVSISCNPWDEFPSRWSIDDSQTCQLVHSNGFSDSQVHSLVLDLSSCYEVSLLTWNDADYLGRQATWDDYIKSVRQQLTVNGQWQSRFYALLRYMFFNALSKAKWPCYAEERWEDLLDRRMVENKLREEREFGVYATRQLHRRNEARGKKRYGH